MATPELKIDAHQHFWKYDAAVHAWITPEMQAIQRDFLPADLQPVLEKAGIDGCITVQVDQTEEDNEFMLQHASEWDFILGVVGWVDLSDPNVGERLDHYKQMPKMKGFRHILQSIPDRAFMLKPAFKRGVGQLQSRGYTYDILIYPDQLGYTREFVASFPNQPFIIDHIAKPHIKDRYITEEWIDAIQAVA